MTDSLKPLFSLGQCVGTPGALQALDEAGQSPSVFLDRHIRGDWGDVCPDDAEANDQALKDGSRIFSVYHTKTSDKLWVITEAINGNGERASTAILTPDEY